MTSPQPVKILMVCMGNICRSPLAENILRHKIRQRNMDGRFVVDSAGTGAWHVGEAPDPRAQAVAARHGIEMTGTARQVRPEDFTRFDWLVCMDNDNKDHLLSIGAPPERTHLLLELHARSDVRDVPDPYYGGADGFHAVFQLIDAACESLLDRLLNGQQLGQ